MGAGNDHASLCAARSLPPCDVTESQWACRFAQGHEGPHRNAEGLCIGPWVACCQPSMYEVIYEWLAENMPRALALCPYKVVRRER